MPGKKHEVRIERLPIKLILPKQGMERRVPASGGKPVPFREVDAKFRSSLARQVSAARDALGLQLRRVGCVPLRVQVLPKAVAKSHRPKKLFDDAGCPIVGAGRLGELFVKATPAGLDRLVEQIRSTETQQVTKDLSTITSIDPVTPEYRRQGASALDILRHCPRGDAGFVARVRLFDYGALDGQDALVGDFEKACGGLKLSVAHGGYAPTSYTYEVECAKVDEIEALSRVIGVRSVAPMPLVRTIRPSCVNAGPIPKELSGPDGTDFPAVVVVDSGICDGVDALRGWIVGRRTDVAPQYRNPDHGTFVAGLICWGGRLNPDLGGIDDSPCGVFDLQVVPNDDPSRGDTDELRESEFLASLEEALKEHANRFRVWNLSLSTNEVCSLDAFSALAEQLDILQEKYQVTFVVSAGNYESPPLLDYPRTKSQIEVGRITSPADSVLAVTVGAISHVDYKSGGPKRNQPSPFSRHGAGPNYVIKPDLVHYGGACSTDLQHRVGVRSIVEAGAAEDLGTSFSTPLVSRALAQIYHQITPSPSPVLARALLTHHARDPRTGGRVPDGEESFFGFGLPAPPPHCLECTPHSATLVFDDVLRPGYYLEWDDFPYPASLSRDGRYHGEIWMTVAFAPILGARWGTEYCETHIDAHFGVYFDQTSRTTGEVTEKFKGLVPPEHKNPGMLYESFQVQSLRKWAPVRTYHGRLDDKGERGNRWRLKVQLLTRHGVESEGFRSQPFALIVTIADPDRRAPVYDEVGQILRTRFKAENLTLRAATRIRT